MRMKRYRNRDEHYDDRPQKGIRSETPHYFGQSNRPIWADAPEPEIKPQAGRHPMMPWEIGFGGYYDR